MGPLGLSAYKLALDLQVAPIAVSQILRGKRAISADMALRLGRYFGVAPDFWMALQAAEALGVAARTSPDLETVERCEALRDRAFIVRESTAQGLKKWEVMLTAATKKAPQMPAKVSRQEEVREATTTGPARAKAPGNGGNNNTATRKMTTR